ncbi:MAG: pilus (MSHA type) biogenesis protein MshL [Gammaproteobacteria bacterium]|nr:pilus (MSHA type) biogenesis protein MshL [Gammaproteobacteria bacterium]
MKKLIKKYNLLLAISVFSLISACTITEPLSNNNGDAIDAALRDGMSSNRSLKNSSKNSSTLSPEVRNALMPEIIINLPNTPKASMEQEQRFDVVVNNVPAKDFFMGLVKDTKYNMTISPQITGSVTLELKSVTVPKAMDAVRDAYGFEYEKTSYGYQVFPRRLETRVFNVNYIDVDRTGQSQTSVGSGQITNTIQNTLTSTGVSSTQQAGSTPSGLVNTTSNSKFWDLLRLNLETIVGTQDGRSIVLNPRSGVIIVKAFPNELRSVAQYLDKIQNIVHRQVIIEAKILEVELNAQFQSGINWSVLGLTQGFNQAQVFDPNSTYEKNNGSSDLKLFTGALNLQAHYGSAFKSVVNLLNTQGNVNVLSSPRIATINNQKAVIKVGDDRFFVTNVSSNTDNSSTTSNTTANITLTPFFSGISLDVTPQIDENDNVTIHIHPIISKVTQDDRKFTVNNQPQNLPLAASTVRESDSIVRAKNGQVIVIGGLMISSGQSYQSSTPGTEHLPGISGLFKNKNKVASKFELVILLQPRIAETTSDWQKRLREAADDVKKMKGDFSYNLVPTKTNK